MWQGWPGNWISWSPQPEKQKMVEKKLFFWALEITINNAYILFNMTRDRLLTKNAQTHLSLLNFRKALVRQLEAKAAGFDDTTETPRKPVGRPPTLSPIQRAMPGMHLVEHVVKGNDSVCRVCKRCASFVCGTWACRPYLHPTDCFVKYHKPWTKLLSSICIYCVLYELLWTRWMFRMFYVNKFIP